MTLEEIQHHIRNDLKVNAANSLNDRVIVGTIDQIDRQNKRVYVVFPIDPNGKGVMRFMQSGGWHDFHEVTPHT